MARTRKAATPKRGGGAKKATAPKGRGGKATKSASKSA